MELESVQQEIAPIKPARKGCTMPDCKFVMMVRGLCKRHYVEGRRNGTIQKFTIDPKNLNGIIVESWAADLPISMVLYQPKNVPLPGYFGVPKSQWSLHPAQKIFDDVYYIKEHGDEYPTYFEASAFNIQVRKGYPKGKTKCQLEELGKVTYE